MHLWQVLVLALLLPSIAWAETTLEAHGIPVSTGAAPGFVPDAICATCHKEIADSYAEVGMARAFHKPTRSRVIEDLDAPPFVHDATGHHYTMRWQDGTYQFSRWRLDRDGQPRDLYTAPVDWVMGSGNHSRVYLIREPSGKLIQLPLAWYTQTQSWGMPPGFEAATHSGLNRPVQRNCMTCHNAYVDLPEGADRTGHPNLFPEELPQGIGCQRCHGAGAEHTALALAKAPFTEIRGSITNPEDLSPTRERDLCYSCHLQPAVTIQGVLRHGRGFSSFRPGDTLTDHFLNMEFQDGDRVKSDRFDINHHPYRMEQSACFVQSEGELTCATCHDPHRKVPATERAAYYRTQCLTCHETDDRDLPTLVSGRPHPDVAADADCTTCHMPKRRTEDVIEVTMTDHLITRDPGPLEDLIARRPKHQPQVVSVDLFDDLPNMPEAEQNLYILSSILTYDSKGLPALATQFANLVLKEQPDAYEPWLLALKTLIAQNRYREARPIADGLIARAPDLPDTIANVALMRYALGQRTAGKGALIDLARSHPHMTTPLMNLANILIQERRLGEASRALRIVLDQEPNHWRAWTLLARIDRAEGDTGAAIEAYLTALKIEPRAKDNRADLATLLDEVGRTDDARHYRDP